MTAAALTHKIRLDPTGKQQTYFRQACGVARFTWNWALAEWKRQVQAGKNPNALELKKQFNAIKPVQFAWMYDVTKYASQQPFIFLQSAFKRFFNKQSNYPQFKKKGVHDSFYIGNDHIKLDGMKIHIPKLGWVPMREALRFSGKVISATISRTADKWFVSLNVTLDQPPLGCENQAAIGVDLGIKRPATLFDGTAKTIDPRAQAAEKVDKQIEKASTSTIPQTERFPQSAQSSDESGASALPYSLYPAGCTSQAHFLFDVPLRSNCHRRPERKRHAEKPSTFPRDCRYGFP
jgi:transposase